MNIEQTICLMQENNVDPPYTLVTPKKRKRKNKLLNEVKKLAV